jgi:hypothetical protein
MMHHRDGDRHASRRSVGESTPASGSPIAQLTELSGYWRCWQKNAVSFSSGEGSMG